VEFDVPIWSMRLFCSWKGEVDRMTGCCFAFFDLFLVGFWGFEFEFEFGLGLGLGVLLALEEFVEDPSSNCACCC